MVTTKKIILIFIILITTVIFLRVFIGEHCSVPSPSMSPTIMTGDYLWINKFAYGANLPVRFADIPLLNIFTWIPSLREADMKNDWGYHRFPGPQKPQVNDIVVFFSVEDENTLFVKRIHSIVDKGLSLKLNVADFEKLKTIVENDGNMLISKENAIYLNGELQTNYVPKQNQYYMLGDNSENSYDSRSYGYIPESHIIGKVNTVLFSIDKDRAGFEKMRRDRIFHPIK